MAATILLLGASVQLAWDYLFFASNEEYRSDEVEFVLLTPEDGVHLGEEATLKIRHEIHPSREVIHAYFPPSQEPDPLATVLVLLSRGNHTTIQWYCAAGEPVARGHINSEWSTLDEPLVLTMEAPDGEPYDYPADPEDRPSGVSTFQLPNVTCQRQGELSLEHGQGRTSIAPTSTTVSSNLEDGVEWEVEQELFVPSSWDRVMSTRYAVTITGSEEYSGLSYENDTPQWISPQGLDWWDTNNGAMLFIDREAELEAERGAWLSALLAGLGAGLLPTAVRELRSPRSGTSS